MRNEQKIFGEKKILNHPEKINAWLNGEDSLITFEIHLSNACNNRCPMCSGWQGKEKKGMLSEEEAKDYLTQLKEAGAKAAIFSGGGEPLVNPHFSKVIEYANELGFDIGVMTNGLALDDKNIKSILTNCNFCRISLDAGTPEMHKKIHGMSAGEFQKTIDNIKQLVKQKKELKSKCDVGIAYLTGKETIDGMEDFAKLAVKLNVDYAQFRPFHNDLTDLTEEIKVLKEKYGGVITGSWQKYNRVNDKVKRPYSKCYGVHFTTAICADANVYVCCHLNGNPKYSLGDLRKNSFFQIWQNRQKVFDKIDFRICPLFGRCDEFNRILFGIKKDKQHINFL